MRSSAASILIATTSAGQVQFGPPINFGSGGSGPGCLAVGDFNLDSKLDLVVTNRRDSTVGVLLGNGDGTFKAAVTYPLNQGLSFPVCVAVGDFNEDGKLDLAVVNGLVGDFGGTIGLFFGNGDGTFKPSVNVQTNISPLSIAIGDFNGDGHLDMFLGGNGSSAVLLGNGDGTFKRPVIFSATPDEGPVFGTAVADVNRDGHLDLIGTSFTAHDVGVLLGNGDGTFQPAQTFAVGNSPNALALGDFNQDGKVDITVSDFDDDGVSILLGNGDGTFQPNLEFFAGVGPSSVKIAEFNGDGKLDLVLSNFGGDGVTILLGDGDGFFEFGGDFPTGASPSYVVVDDFNGDGVSDLAVANFGSNNISILLNQAFIRVSIEIKPGESQPRPINPRSPGKIAVAIFSSAQFDVARVNRNSLTFGRTGDEESLAFCDSILQDVNADGFPDLVCHFTTQKTGFQAGDSKGVLKGRTLDGVPIIGVESIEIVPR